MRRSARIATLVAIVAAFALAFALTPPRGPRSIRLFDAERLADLEVRIWQAHDNTERLHVFWLLATRQHDRYHYAWATATIEGFHLTRAAETFRDLNGGYDVVLPDLEAAYERVRSWTEASFDARAVARAELAWWIARRTPGANSPEQVGQLIAQEYALLYDTSPQRMADAALLLAQAATLHDAHADHPDWAAIAQLLRQSYLELRLALASANA